MLCVLVMQNYRKHVLLVTSPSSLSSGASLEERSRLHEFTPLRTILRSLPRRVEAHVVMLKVNHNRSKLSQIGPGRPRGR